MNIEKILYAIIPKSLISLFLNKLLFERSYNLSPENVVKRIKENSSGYSVVLNQYRGVTCIEIEKESIIFYNGFKTRFIGECFNQKYGCIIKGKLNFTLPLKIFFVIGIILMMRVSLTNDSFLIKLIFMVIGFQIFGLFSRFVNIFNDGFENEMLDLFRKCEEIE